MFTDKKKLTINDSPSKKVERLPDMVASDFQEIVHWVKKNPIKASAMGIIGVVALRNRTFRGMLGSAAVSFIASKIFSNTEHTLH